MGNFNNVTMGSGTLKINDVDVGFLKGDVNFKYQYDVEDFKTGVPRSLRGSTTKEVTAELTAPMAEMSADNLAIALGGLTVEDVGTPKTSERLNLGVQFSLGEVKVEFVHTRPSTGKAITVVFWTANADGKANISFAEEKYIVNDVTFRAVYDEDHEDNPLGYIDFEE